jgi:paraquat-inducible protein A
MTQTAMPSVITTSSSRRTQHSVPLLLGTAFSLFAAGIFFPFFHVTKFWLFDDAVSVVGGIFTLFREGEYFLFAVLTLFTLVFPCVKLGLLAIIWAEREHDLTRVRLLHRWVEHLGKWSMLDVFVVAILIVAMKSAAVAEIHIGLGLYLFTFSVIATQFASALVARLLNQH